MSEISKARGSLKKAPPGQNNYSSLPQNPGSNKPKPSQSPVSVPTDTSNLSIQQRIALMKGKSVGGLEIQVGGTPKTPMKPNLAAKQAHSSISTQKPSLPMKPQANHLTPNKPMIPGSPRSPGSPRPASRSRSPQIEQIQNNSNHESSHELSSHFPKNRYTPQTAMRPNEALASSPMTPKKDWNTMENRQKLAVPQVTVCSTQLSVGVL